jgi:hypothetical protein
VTGAVHATATPSPIAAATRVGSEADKGVSVAETNPGLSAKLGVMAVVLMAVALLVATLSASWKPGFASGASTLAWVSMGLSFAPILGALGVTLLAVSLSLSHDVRSTGATPAE